MRGTRIKGLGLVSGKLVVSESGGNQHAQRGREGGRGREREREKNKREREEDTHTHTEAHAYTHTHK